MEKSNAVIQRFVNGGKARMANDWRDQKYGGKKTRIAHLEDGGTPEEQIAAHAAQVAASLNSVATPPTMSTATTAQKIAAGVNTPAPRPTIGGSLWEGVKAATGFGNTNNAISTYARNPTLAPATDEIQMRANGGAIQHIGKCHNMLGGGKVKGPGTGTSDSIPAMLSNGEYVLPADSVKAIGKNSLDQLKDATHVPVNGKGEASRLAKRGVRHLAEGTPSTKTPFQQVTGSPRPSDMPTPVEAATNLMDKAFTPRAGSLISNTAPPTASLPTTTTSLPTQNPLGETYSATMKNPAPKLSATQKLAGTPEQQKFYLDNNITEGNTTGEVNQSQANAASAVGATGNNAKPLTYQVSPSVFALASRPNGKMDTFSGMGAPGAPEITSKAMSGGAGFSVQESPNGDPNYWQNRLAAQNQGSPDIGRIIQNKLAGSGLAQSISNQQKVLENAQLNQKTESEAEINNLRKIASGETGASGVEQERALKTLSSKGYGTNKFIPPHTDAMGNVLFPGGFADEINKTFTPLNQSQHPYEGLRGSAKDPKTGKMVSGSIVNGQFIPDAK